MNESLNEAEKLVTINDLRKVVSEVIPKKILHNYSEGDADLLSKIELMIQGNNVTLDEHEYRRIELSTGGQCLVNVQALAMSIANQEKLRLRYREMFFLQGVQSANRKFNENLGANHAYLVVKDEVTSLYAAISPSGYRHNQAQNRNRLSEIIVGKSLDDVKRQIEILENGVWPNVPDLSDIETLKLWFVAKAAIMRIDPSKLSS